MGVPDVVEKLLGYAGISQFADRIVPLGFWPVHARHRTLVLRVDGDGTGVDGVGFSESVFEKVLEVGLRRFKLFGANVTTSDERLGVEGSNGAFRFDEVIHQRLRHRRVVALVVAATAVTHEVDDDVGFEGLPVVEGDFGNTHDRFRVVAVDVKNGRLDGFGHIGRIHTRAGVVGQRREADLVVHYHVDGSSGAVGAKLRHLQGL